MPKRIDFMVAGVQKGGTTSLDVYLRQHPAIVMARRKEAHFFDKRQKTGLRSLNHWIYNRNFDWSAQTDGARLGESTPIYTWWAGAMERIWAYNPRIRVITVLRDPVERAWSHYRMDRRLGRETEDFITVIRQEAERARRTLPLQDRVRSQVARGFYAEQVRRLKRLFPDEQLLFIRSEDLASNPHPELEKVCQLLDIACYAFEEELGHNGAGGEELLPPDARAFLEQTYRFDAAETRRMLGWDKGPWSV